MEYFSIIKDADIFEHPLKEPKEYITRPTVRAIILDQQNNICVYYINDRTQFPGGGVEEGETLEQACKRECLEEVGVNITSIRPLGRALEYRAKLEKCYDVTFFTAKIEGEKGEPTTSDEIEKCIRIEWLPETEIRTRLQEQIKNFPPIDQESMYVPHFNFRTSFAAFEEYLRKK